MEKSDVSKLFKELLGSQLSSVEFVQDYLQLRFDGPCISVFNPLTVKTKQSEITSWNDGFRDLLCNQITKVVTQVSFESNKQLSIEFMDRSEINVSLRADDYSSPEAIDWDGFKNGGWFCK